MLDSRSADEGVITDDVEYTSDSSLFLLPYMFDLIEQLSCRSSPANPTIVVITSTSRVDIMLITKSVHAAPGGGSQLRLALYCGGGVTLYVHQALMSLEI
jgi:hypothetical protein